MIPVESVAAIACLGILLASCQPGTSSTRDAASGEQLRVTSVADGDTLTGLDKNGQHVRVRLLGIDAPEGAHDGRPAECGADAAKAALQALVLHHDVTLINDPHADHLDRYGRRLAYVELGTVDAAQQQVDAGYVEAWYPRSEPQPERHPAYQQAQRAAQQSRVGSWAHCPRLGR